MRKFYPLIIAFIFALLYLYSLTTLEPLKKTEQQSAGFFYILPGPIAKITTLDYDGLAADYLMLKIQSYYGGTLERTERPRVTEAEWRWMYDVLTVATDLDPYFFDPYYFANSFFTWDAHMVKETNTLLTKGNRFRDWDWLPAFYIGFNEFYFLHDNAKASEYLMQSSKKPGAAPFLASLAVRLAYKSSRTEIAIMFLQQTIKESKDKVERETFEKRLKTLQRIFFLEKAITFFKTKQGSNPASLQDLIAQDVVSRIPQDPYGGKFYIDTDGSVKTTSDLR